MQFIDYVTVKIKAGNGGPGCSSFRREKYVPRGGPDGGDGGRGGHVIIKTDVQLNTLLDLRYHHIYKAQDGEKGMGQKMHGCDGESLVIRVPVGTIIKDAVTGEVIADLDGENKSIKAVKGGKGGLGNSHFATSVKQAPTYAQPGLPGEEREIIVELKLLADVGLIGLPNVGKSTLIAAISSAKPKIADYPFTTLVPNLGVVKHEDLRSFVVADIPGLIEGAHSGAGLGFQFLRHVERTAILAHLVDVSPMSDVDPIEAFESVEKELALYSEEITKKQRVVIASKIDVADPERLDNLREYCKTNGYDFFAVSAATHEGLHELLVYLSSKVKE